MKKERTEQEIGTGARLTRVRAALDGLIRRHAFGLAILMCAAVSFSFPSAFTTWGGVRLTRLVSPLATPFLMKLLAGRFVVIDTGAMMLSILEIVIVPIAVGGVFRRVFGRWLDAHKAVADRVLSVVSMAGICFTILALTAPSRDTFREAGALIVLAAALHNTVGYLGGYGLTRLLGRFLPLDERDARTVAIEVGMQNGGMAGALATDVLRSAVAALPANVFSIWMNFSGSLLASRWSRRAPLGG